MGSILEKWQGLLCKITREGVPADLDSWIEIGRWGLDPAGGREVAGRNREPAWRRTWPAARDLAGAHETGPRDHDSTRGLHGEKEERTTNLARHLTRARSGQKRCVARGAMADGCARVPRWRGDLATWRGGCGSEARDRRRRGLGLRYLWPEAT